MTTLITELEYIKGGHSFILQIPFKVAPGRPATFYEPEEAESFEWEYDQIKMYKTDRNYKRSYKEVAERDIQDCLEQNGFLDLEEAFGCYVESLDMADYYSSSLCET